MKTLRFTKSAVSMILALIMLVSMCTVAFVNVAAAQTDDVMTSADTDTASTGAVNLKGGEKLYFKPNDNWKQANARFACYFYTTAGSATAWVRAELHMEDFYVVTVPNGNWTHYIWCRMNPSSSTNNWDNRWNQSANLQYDGVNNLFSYNTGDVWDGGEGTFNKYTFFTSGETIYFTEDTSKGLTWDDAGAWFAVHFYDAKGNTTWTVAQPCVFDAGYYKITVPQNDKGENVDWDRMIIVRQNPAFSDLAFDYSSDPKKTWGQTTNMWDTQDDTKKCFQIKSTYDDNGHAVFDGEWIAFAETTEVPKEGITETIYVRDDTSSNANNGLGYLTDDDAKLFIVTNAGDTVEMTQSIDAATGNTLWYADVDTAATQYTILRTSFYFKEKNVLKGSAVGSYWGAWSTSDSARNGSNTLYITGEGSGAASWLPSKGRSTAIPVSTDTESDDYKYNYWHGIWVDSKSSPVADADPNNFIKWYAVSRSENSEYDLYLPSYVNIKAVKLYTSFDNATITGGAYTDKPIFRNAPNTLNLSSEDGKYTITVDGDTYTLNVYHTEGTAAMLLTTPDYDLFTGVTDSNQNPNAWPIGKVDADTYVSEYKDGIKVGGTYYMYDADGTQINSKTKLKQIKGRGNSSFQASMLLYGKYAYNIGLDKKDKLIDSAVASKKWSLLANNVDPSMLRNTFIYDVADELGLPYSSETRIIDLYDNGNYLGCYILTEKVEYGEDYLMDDMENLDKGIEKANMKAYGYDGDDYVEDNGYMIEDLMDYVEQKKASIDIDGQTYEYSYTDFDRETIKDECIKDGGTLTEEKVDAMVYLEPENFREYNYLLEFELWDRYENEACWFVCPNTEQAIVVKYPETASKDVMEWIIGEWAAVQTSVYSEDYDTYSKLIDVESFAKMYLIQELALNLDACATSYYVHNRVGEGPDGQSKLYASPVWDYDWSFGSYASGNGEKKYTVSSSSINVADHDQMFVKVKSVKTGPNDTVHDQNDYNFQAMLCQSDEFWADCQDIWTNEMLAVLADYLDEDTKNDTIVDGILLSQMMPEYESAALMNDARWNTYRSGLLGDPNRTEGHLDTWGSKNTSNYTPGTYSFHRTKNETSSDGTEYSFANTVYYLNDWLIKRIAYMSDDGGLLAEDKEYVIDGVDFTASLSDNGKLTVTPIVDTATHGGTDLKLELVTYSVYIDGECVETLLLSDGDAVVEFPAGSHDVYIVASPVDCDTVSAQSESQRFTFASTGGVADLTIYFKSSDSYRYIPSVIVGSTTYEMVKEGDAFGSNASFSQDYYWYKATVPATLGGTVNLTFTNVTGMSASVTVTDVENKAYYFGADNLNKDTVAVDLTSFKESGDNEVILNFHKSATHMVYNNYYDAGIAQTNIGGTTYVLGDTDGDDTLSILDATTIQLALVEKTELEGVRSDLADYDLDTVTSIVDATAIQTYLVNN